MPMAPLGEPMLAVLVALADGPGTVVEISARIGTGSASTHGKLTRLIDLHLARRDRVTTGKGNAAPYVYRRGFMSLDDVAGARCPTCKASPGEPCWHQSAPILGHHRARFTAAWRNWNR